MKHFYCNESLRAQPKSYSPHLYTTIYDLIDLFYHSLHNHIYLFHCRVLLSFSSVENAAHVSASTHKLQTVNHVPTASDERCHGYPLLLRTWTLPGTVRGLSDRSPSCTGGASLLICGQASVAHAFMQL